MVLMILTSNDFLGFGQNFLITESEILLTLEKYFTWNLEPNSFGSDDKNS